MKRSLFVISIGLLFSCNSTIQKDNSSQSSDFKHEWEVEEVENTVIFKSTKQAPIPFSYTGEPQAIMIVAALKLDAKSEKKLKQIVEKEIIEIRKDVRIVDYLEEDYSAKDNIVSYFDKFQNTKIAVIKYRTNGEIQGEEAGARSVRQILFIVNDKLYISTLMVLYAEYQDDMRSDQMNFIKTIIDKSKK